MWPVAVPTQMGGGGANISTVSTRGTVGFAGACVGYCCVLEVEGRWIDKRLESWEGGGWVVGVQSREAVGRVATGLKLEAGDKMSV